MALPFSFLYPTTHLRLIGTMLLRIKYLKEEDIERTTSPDRKKQEYKFVEWVKTHIKTVIDHHTDASYTDVQKEEDRKN